MDLRPEDKAWVQQTWDMLTDCKKHELLGVRKACDFINIDIIYSITRSFFTQRRKFRFDELFQIRTAPLAPSDEGAGAVGDWGRENLEILLFYL